MLLHRRRAHLRQVPDRLRQLWINAEPRHDLHDACARADVHCYICYMLIRTYVMAHSHISSPHLHRLVLRLRHGERNRARKGRTCECVTEAVSVLVRTITSRNCEPFATKNVPTVSLNLRPAPGLATGLLADSAVTVMGTAVTMEPLKAHIRTGRAYMNIHAAAPYGGGIIRGQVEPQ
jgi:hypothetical protein